jgi:hypothetical protein
LRRSRDALAAAMATGKLADGSPLTSDARHEREQAIDATARFVDEIAAMPRILPDVAFRDELTQINPARLAA